ncbi:hypothetical protein GCM10017788_39930 [Amycolatopsis acidiphila]|nr:hypothetical protein GCM10017788_39930 [Amycolatopsis acidiphila]
MLRLPYLRGALVRDFVPALRQFLGSTKGLSGPVIAQLTEQWKTEQRAFAQRGLSDVDYVYLWTDGIHVNILLEEGKLCLLAMIGVRTAGRKELVALTDGACLPSGVVVGMSATFGRKGSGRATHPSRAATTQARTPRPPREVTPKPAGRLGRKRRALPQVEQLRTWRRRPWTRFGAVTNATEFWETSRGA